MTREEKYKKIEDYFSDFLLSKRSKSDRRNLTHNLMVVLNSLGDKTYAIEIVDEPNTCTFYGMSVYPSPDELDTITNELIGGKLSLSKLVKRCGSIKQYLISIDSRVFNADIITFNPNELTAILLHEIGHVVQSSDWAESFLLAYNQLNLARNFTDKAASKVIYQIYKLPLIVYLSSPFGNVINSSNGYSIKKEYKADNMVIDSGYGEHLASALGKIISAYGTAILKNEKENYHKLESEMIWCNLCSHDIIDRRHHIIKELGVKSRTNSSFFRRIADTIGDKLGLVKVDRIGGVVANEAFTVNDFLDNDYAFKYDFTFDPKKWAMFSTSMRLAKESAMKELANESFLFFNRKQKVDIPSQLEVDRVSVEVDRISNHADRKYVLDLIYNLEERIMKVIELGDINKTIKDKYSLKMSGMLRTLGELRHIVLGKRSFETEYKLFVKYPKGYEG